MTVRVILWHALGAWRGIYDIRGVEEVDSREARGRSGPVSEFKVESMAETLRSASTEGDRYGIGE